MTKSSVFLSFAGADRPAAGMLDKHLGVHQVKTFYDDRDIEPGQNIVSTISDAISDATWFVLLWSCHTATNQFAEAEWTAALKRGIDEQRPFLFVVTLDTSPLPALLQPSSFVRFEGDWQVVTDRLLAAWRWDASGRGPQQRPSSDVGILVRNEALWVSHVVTVPSGITGHGLMAVVSASLRLKTEVSAFDGQLGARLRYRLEHDGCPLSDNKPVPSVLAEQGQAVDLVVRAEWFGPQWTGNADAYRYDGPVLNADIKRRLAQEAFRHLRHRPDQRG